MFLASRSVFFWDLNIELNVQKLCNCRSKLFFGLKKSDFLAGLDDHQHNCVPLQSQQLVTWLTEAKASTSCLN